MVRLYVQSQRSSAACHDGRSTVQCHILSELLRSEPLTQQDLVERLGLDKGWISRAVEALVADGAIDKRQHQDDRRSAWLLLSEAGRARASALNLRLNQHAGSLLSALDDQQQADLHASLLVLLQALQPAAANPCHNKGERTP